MEDLVPLIDLNTLYRLHWGSKNTKGEEHRRLIREEFEPRLERYIRETLSDSKVRVRGAYGIFPAASEGEALVVFDPANRSSELVRFDFPRQPDRDRLCLADYFRPISQAHDLVAIQIVTVGDELLSRTDVMMDEGDYSEGYFLRGFGAVWRRQPPNMCTVRSGRCWGSIRIVDSGTRGATVPVRTRSSTGRSSVSFRPVRAWGWH